MATYMDEEKNTGYFALNLYPDPDLLAGDRADLEVVLLMDISGSQSGWAIEKEKEISNIILSRLLSTDRLSVLAFNTSVFWAFGQGTVVDATADNITLARNFINGQSAGGGTALLSGVQASLNVPATSEHQRIYIFLTDGFITNEAAIFEEIRNHPSQPTVFTFGAGDNLNRYFLDEAATIGNGFSTEITQNDPVEDMVDAAWNKIESPQLESISISFGNVEVSEMVLPVNSNLFVGSPYSVYGQYATGGLCQVTLSGYRDGQPVTIEKEITLARESNISHMIPQVWARQKIARLETEEGTGTQNKLEIIDLSVEYQVLSKYTAFLAIDPTPVEEGQSLGGSGFFSNTDVLDRLFTSVDFTIDIKDGFLWINIPEGQLLYSVRVFDINGRVLFEWSGGSSTSTDNLFKWDGRRLNGDILKPGQYFIQIQTNLGTVSKKITWTSF
ncbi:T9SS type A sorting domain-containing protein [Fibrobacterota bacterium]